MPKRTVVRDYLAERSFGEQVRIDMDRLDEECLQFPDDFFAASEAVTDAEERYMIRKAREDEIRTRMDMKVRNSPELYGLEKVTEPGVKAAIQASDKVKEAGERTMKSELEWKRAKNKVSALIEKRRMIEASIELVALNWFATPRDKRGGADKIRRNSTDDRVAKKLRRKE